MKLVDVPVTVQKHPRRVEKMKLTLHLFITEWLDGVRRHVYISANLPFISLSLSFSPPLFFCADSASADQTFL
jgi:hypothetical protein